jgi:7-keto-8-aminopelargonate synthetase-like enzyme
VFDTEEEAFAAARRLKQAGVLILPAFYPTVARGTGLMRFAVSALHQQDDLETAARALGLIPEPSTNPIALNNKEFDQ